MNISRVTTISLVLAVVVLALAYANPLSAKGKDCDPEGDHRPKCDDDPAASDLTFMVEMDGAFVINELMTSDGNELLSDEEITIDRPGFDSEKEFGIACSEITDLDEKEACLTWDTVFNCNIYDDLGTNPHGPDQFTTTPGRRGQPQWEVYKFGGGVVVFFVTSIKSHISLDPLSVVLQLTSKCTYHADHLDDFPNRTLCTEPFLSNPTTTFDMQHFWNHANGKKGVAHAQLCHLGEGELDPSHSTLTITACTDEETPDCTRPE